MKLHLTIGSGSLTDRQYDLETGFLTVGRGENCSVRFDPVTERIASKQHAFIEAKPDGYYISDNRSTNGTLVNGELVQTKKLNDGDTIQFGRNGVTATITIDPEIKDAASTAANFEQYQAAKFEQAAESHPVSLQNSISQIGLGNLSTVPKASKTGRYVGIGVTIFGIIFLSLIVVALMVTSVGVIPAVIAAFVAFVPAIIYLLPMVWLDRYDPEPIWLLALAFAWGALVAVVVSFIINTLIAVIVGIGISPQVGEAVGAVMSAPIFEEGSKGLGLIILLIFFRRYFDDILDGIVFAGVIALGFATVENVLYYGRALGQGGFPALILTFVMRGIMSPFAHVTFTSMTGIGCGISRESHNKIVRVIMPMIGYAGAVTLHAIWNGAAVVGGFETFLYGYFILGIPFFFIFVGFAFYIMHRQNKILKEMLAIDVARGLIPEDHAKIATSAFRSSGWLLSGILAGKFFARSRYLRSIGKLGLSYWHIQRATAAQGQTGSFQQNPILREEVVKWRNAV